MITHYGAYMNLLYISDADINILQKGDMIFGIPLPIDDEGFNSRIRRAKIINKDKDAIYLYDLDRSYVFYWDLNAKATNNNYAIFLVVGYWLFVSFLL